MPEITQVITEAADSSGVGQFVRFPGSPFELFQPYLPAGDQPQAIDKLVEGINDGEVFQTLLGVTGSGKTYTMANVIARLGRPAIVFAPNKTLAAQLYAEFREFFPHNAVEYFVSYYDYYQPEAYVPQRDLFIEKDSSINEHIEQMRLSCTKSVLERGDVVIVTTVSAIYGIGDPVDYHSMILHLRAGEKLEQRDIIRRLTEMQYERNEMTLIRGKFRVKGDVLEIHPSDAELRGITSGDVVELTSRVGTTRMTAVVLDRMQPGVVYTTFHHPESGANVITTENSDWATNCPEYKVTAVQVEPVTQPSEWQQRFKRFSEEQAELLAKREAARA